jgi:hypothetical protein
MTLEEFVGLLHYCRRLGDVTLSAKAGSEEWSLSALEETFSGATLHEVATRLGLALDATAIENKFPIGWKPGPIKIMRTREGQILLYSRLKDLMYLGSPSPEINEFLGERGAAFCMAEVVDHKLVIVGECDESVYENSGMFEEVRTETDDSSDLADAPDSGDE